MVTNGEIIALRDKSRALGDHLTAALCVVALKEGHIRDKEFRALQSSACAKFRPREAREHIARKLQG